MLRGTRTHGKAFRQALHGWWSVFIGTTQWRRVLYHPSSTCTFCGTHHLPRVVIISKKDYPGFLYSFIAMSGGFLVYYKSNLVLLSRDHQPILFCHPSVIETQILTLEAAQWTEHYKQLTSKLNLPVANNRWLYCLASAKCCCTPAIDSWLRIQLGESVHTNGTKLIVS